MAGGGLFGGAGAFWATRALEVVKRNDSPGLLWKRIKLTTTRKNNAKKRLKRLWQVTPARTHLPSSFPFLLLHSVMISLFPDSCAVLVVGPNHLDRQVLDSLESSPW
uniref:Uncharacterized protein n=1 Tax=Avena sativa TaxID=4498 RepID=A0ACD5Y573_AVESA